MRGAAPTDAKCSTMSDDVVVGASFVTNMARGRDAADTTDSRDDEDAPTDPETVGLGRVGRLVWAP